LLTLRRAPIALLAALAALVLLGADAGPALAWNTTAEGLELGGTVTIEDGGTSEQKSCSFAEDPRQSYSLWDEGSTASYFEGHGESWTTYGSLALACSGGTVLYWKPYGEIWEEEGSGPVLALYNSGEVPSPFGGFMTGDSSPVAVPWVDAAGGSPSHVTLEDELIGWGGSYQYPITMSGTVTFTTASGGDLTIP
jgi:hypothetical protein